MEQHWFNIFINQYVNNFSVYDADEYASKSIKQINYFWWNIIIIIIIIIITVIVIIIIIIIIVIIIIIIKHCNTNAQSDQKLHYPPYTCVLNTCTCGCNLATRVSSHLKPNKQPHVVHIRHSMYTA